MYKLSTPEFLSLDFVIVGGGIAGLTAAIALGRAGHHVTLFEQRDDFDCTILSGGARITPDISRVFYRWGMEKQFKEHSISTNSIIFKCYDSGVTLGDQTMEQDAVIETGGDFLMMHYAELRKILHEGVLANAVSIRKERVASVQPRAEQPSVTLTSGEVVDTDVIIGADGILGLTRKSIIRDGESLKYLGTNMWNVTIPEESIRADPSLHHLLTDQAHNWYSDNGYGVLGFPVGVGKFSLFVYTPGPPNQDLTKWWSTPDELVAAMGSGDPQLLKVAAMASAVVLVPMAESPHLEDWVHPEGRMLVIGEAAHPLHPGSMYAVNMVTGDAMVLGRLFQHLHHRGQIDSFLAAVQEIRQKRILEVHDASQDNIYAMALPAGTEHDDIKDKGKKLGTAMEESQKRDLLQSVFQGIFAYDPEDEADSWWLQWGLLQERAVRSASFSIEVDEDVDERVSPSP